MMTVLLVMVLFTACSDAPETSPGNDANVDESSNSAIEVALAKATYRSLSAPLTVSGQVEAYERVYVAAQKSGIIEELTVEEGDRVEAGMLLARLDTREQRAEMRRAEASLAEAERNLDRVTQLYEREVATQAEYEDAQVALERAESEVELWQTRLEFGEVRAPINAVVTAKLVERGNTVNANERLFTIADFSNLVIRVGVSELDVVHLNRGDSVDLTLDAYPGERVQGQIRRIFPSAEAESRLFTVEVQIDQSRTDQVIRPGFLGRVSFDRDGDGVLAIPSEAVRSREGASYVYVLDGEADVVRERRISRGVTRHGWTEVTDGLEAGELVAASNVRSLTDGALVSVEPFFQTPEM